ncbi:c-type cytochrome [Novosphingobium sp. BL-52-GroH]|uniref:c-type cytochrome n=1 Tax=Novosphingobium sp. BL-52-GroH TaxID=3349877 RepID=UPI00384D870B
MKHLIGLAGLAAVVALPVLPAQAQAQTAPAPDPVMGKKQFGPCSVCHTVDKAKPDGVGPNLFAVYGSKAATRRAKFAYSAPLKASNLTWDDATLDKWITDPATVVKGNKMHFMGLPRKPARANIIAYLKTVK